MRYKPSDPRYDHTAGVMAHAGKYAGGKALIVLGGHSASNWEELYARIQPDVLLGANGVNAMIQGLDYWMIAENMRRSSRLAKEGDPAGIQWMEMFHREAGARCKLVSHHSWDLLKDSRNCVRIRRQGYELDELIPMGFNLREYGLGYWAGWLLQHKDAGAEVHVGTVGLQLLHHAGILGCAEVHTIGYDLQFKDPAAHHWYEYPVYRVDRYRTPAAFVEYRGVPSQWAWIESAQYLKATEWIFKRDGLQWIDHSDGLLKLEGLEAAQGI